jgi:IS1 family transposase
LPRQNKRHCDMHRKARRQHRRHSLHHFVIGDRTNEAAKTFWEKIKGCGMRYMSSDYWKPYESVILRENICK